MRDAKTLDASVQLVVSTTGFTHCAFFSRFADLSHYLRIPTAVAKLALSYLQGQWLGMYVCMYGSSGRMHARRRYG